NDADRNPCVDLSSCRRLGVRSILAAPLCHFRRTLGVFEVLSSAPHAFDGRDVATMQMLSIVMVAAMSRLSNDRPALNSAYWQTRQFLDLLRFLRILRRPR